MTAGIRSGTSNDGYIQVNGNDIITALSGGNVGIGTSSPSTKLHVNGTITATNFAGSGGMTTDDWIVHTGDTDTKLGFSANDTISFHTAGAEVLKITSTGNLELPNNNDYLKIGSGGPLNLVHTGSAAFISNSTGFLTYQCDTHQWKKGDGSVEYFRATNSGVAIGHVGPVRKFSVKSSGENAVSISLLDNNSTNEIWRVGQASDGDGYVEVLEDGGTVGCKLDASGNSFTMGKFGVGKSSPSHALDVLETSSQTVARFLGTHNTLGGGVQIKNNNANGGVEFLNKDGSNQAALYHSTGGWTWSANLQILGTAGLRIGTTSGHGQADLVVDTNTTTDGDHIAHFKGQTSGSNAAGLGIVYFTCGGDDNRAGLMWEHQNVSNERMWMGDDLRLHLSNNNPTLSTQGQGGTNSRYIMTVAAGVPDFPDGSSADDAAKSALEIKKHYPASQNGNYWIFDHNGTPRQIYCEMEIDGGGWMLWNDHNNGQTSMNEALGGSSTSPNSGLARGNWNNYAHYQVLIRASDIDNTVVGWSAERLHSIVQLDANGAIKYIADYGADFFHENVGDQFQPERTDYFHSGSTSEYIQMDRAYAPQLGATNWETFSNNGWQVVYIREMDSRMCPGMHRSCHLVERIYGFDDAGVPFWTQSDSMSPLPFFTDVRFQQSQTADGHNDQMLYNFNNRKLFADNGNNGASIQGRMHGCVTGEFECEYTLGYGWGWSIASAVSTIQIAENLRDGSSNPYIGGTNHYAYFSVLNNSSNNKWAPASVLPFQAYTESMNSGGSNQGRQVMWRESDGTIKVKRRDGTHGTYTYPQKYAGPLIFVSGQQSPHYTEWHSIYDNKRSGSTLNGRDRWYK